MNSNNTKNIYDCHRLLPEYAASIWNPHLAVLWGLLKGITGEHPRCPRSCMILAVVTLKTVGGTLDWLCSTRLSLGMWPLMHSGLVWWLQTTGPQQIIDTNSGQYGHLRLGCAIHLLSERSVIETSFLLLLLSRRIQLPSKLSWLDVHLFACHDPPPRIILKCARSACRAVRTIAAPHLHTLANQQDHRVVRTPQLLETTASTACASCSGPHMEMSNITVWYMGG